MEKRIKAVLLKFPGTNCDEETRRALCTAGFEAETTPFAAVDETLIASADLVVLPGGFSYGDYIMAGRLAQLHLEQRMGSALRDFRDRGGYILGICNGFQILMRTGLLPRGSLIANASGRFLCTWVRLRNRNPANPFLRELPSDFELPIAHAEGRFVAAPQEVDAYLAEGYAALTYEENPNGSMGAIAGLQDETGRVFGLMPHPERFLYRKHHFDPDWAGDAQWGWGYYFFKSIHDHLMAKKLAPMREPSGAMA